MIQIQDDNFNQSAAAPSSNQTLTQPTPTVAPAQSSKNTAEIDQLLAELDKLSKNLDENPKVETEPAAKVADQAVASPKVDEDATPTDKKFDFDSFLSDLEKKIDQKGGQSSDLDTNSDSDQESSDFRKNRSALDTQVQDKDADEMMDEEVAASKPNSTTESEELKSQNIFEMLGLMNIEDDEKNKFLDDLESMIWDDFIFHDLELLLTSEEYAGARKLLDDKTKSEEQQKEDLIAYLEKLVPDLDEVLYDKALELKSEMMGERLAKMKEDADGTSLAKIKEAEGLISQNRWSSAVSLLNQLS